MNRADKKKLRKKLKQRQRRALEKELDAGGHHKHEGKSRRKKH